MFNCTPPGTVLAGYSWLPLYAIGRAGAGHANMEGLGVSFSRVTGVLNYIGECVNNKISV